MNEARIMRELSHLLGDVGVRRLSDFTIDLKENRAERLIEVSPASAEQASEVIQFAAREGLSIIAAGARAHIDAGNLMTRADLILSIRQMNRLLEHEPADLVATVEAGTTLRDFQKQIAEKGQWLPIDPPDDGSATLGGVVATASSGPQSFGYGPIRSFVIGLRGLLADGRQIKAGGNVVKNVAGYDLCKLFTGSYGTLGVITELTFKLRPLPAETRTIVALGSREALFVAGGRAANQSFPVAIEIVSSSFKDKLPIEANDDDCVLLIRFAGSPRAVITETAQTLKSLRDEKFRCSTYDDDASIWQAVAAMSFGSQADLGWRAQLRPGDLSSFMNEVGALGREDTSHISLCWQADVGTGRVRVVARAPTYHQEAVRALERLRQKAENLGGSLVIERAPVEIKREVDSWGSFGSAGELMKRVKRQLDPENLLSPGRL